MSAVAGSADRARTSALEPEPEAAFWARSGLVARLRLGERASERNRRSPRTTSSSFDAHGHVFLLQAGQFECGHNVVTGRIIAEVHARVWRQFGVRRRNMSGSPRSKRALIGRSSSGLSGALAQKLAHKCSGKKAVERTKIVLLVMVIRELHLGHLHRGDTGHLGLFIWTRTRREGLVCERRQRGEVLASPPSFGALYTPGDSVSETHPEWAESQRQRFHESILTR